MNNEETVVIFPEETIRQLYEEMTPAVRDYVLLLCKSNTKLEQDIKELQETINKLKEVSK